MILKRNHTGHRMGECHQKATLTDDQVREMRATYERWKEEGSRKGYETLAALYGCGISTARDIVQYRTRASA